MKTKVLFTACVFLTMFLQANYSNAMQDATEKNQIKLFTSNQAQNIAQNLVNRYEQEKPGTVIELNQLTGTMDASQIKSGNLGIVTETENATPDNGEFSQIIIGREVFVPIINANNPFVKQIEKQGIQVKNLHAVFSGNQASWETLLGIQSGAASLVHFYVSNDEILTDAVATFLNTSPAAFVEKKLNPAEIVEKIQSDPLAIGFVRLTDLPITNENNLAENLRLLPIDKNENGQLDYNENIYANIDAFKRGVWIGKFPQSLITNIYAVSDLENAGKPVTDFLNWVVTDGQKWMNEAGITELVYNERPLKLEKINQAEIPLNTVETGNGKSFFTLLILLLSAAAGFIGFLFYFRTEKVKKAVLQAVPQLQKTLNEQTFEIPGGVYFDKSHTWIFMEKDGQVKIGIDDFIPKVTGKLTRIIMKNPGETVKRREPVVQLIQQGKQISIYSPVSGIITDINEDLITSPGDVNSSPYEDGWIYQVKPSNWLRETEFLKLGSQYREWIKSELARFKDFLACSHNLEITPGTAVAFQEGGEITAQPLKEMSPKIWDDFQTYFIDTADLY